MARVKNAPRCGSGSQITCAAHCRAAQSTSRQHARPRASSQGGRAQKGIEIRKTGLEPQSPSFCLVSKRVAAGERGGDSKREQRKDTIW